MTQQQPPNNPKPWKATIAVAMVTAILTSGLNWAFWELNRRAILSEKLVDRRLDVIADLASSVSTYRELRRWQAIAAAAVTAEAQALKPMTLEKKAVVEARLEQLMPYESERADKAREYLPVLETQLLLAQLYFGPKTHAATVKMQGVIGKSIEEVVGDYARSNPASAAPNASGVRVNLTGSSIGSYAAEQFAEVAEDVLNAMREELDSPTSIWK